MRSSLHRKEMSAVVVVEATMTTHIHSILMIFKLIEADYHAIKAAICVLTKYLGSYCIVIRHAPACEET